MNWEMRGRKHRYYVTADSYEVAGGGFYIGRIESRWGHIPQVNDIRFHFKSLAAASRWVNSRRNFTKNKVKKHFNS